MGTISGTDLQLTFVPREMCQNLSSTSQALPKNKYLKEVIIPPHLGTVVPT